MKYQRFLFNHYWDCTEYMVCAICVYCNVCAIRKRREMSDPANYRLASLTCVASKMLEHIIHSQIMKHLVKNEVLTDYTSIVSQRNDQLKPNFYVLSIQANKTVHAAILDFSFDKVFDKVPHRRLLKKLNHYVIHGHLLDWFESFLTGRIQSVICEGASSSVTTTSGVPQGTVLGTLPFLLYVNGQ